MKKLYIENQLEKMYKAWIRNEPTLKHLENMDIGDIGWEEEEKMTPNQKEFIDSMIKVMV